jgi:hypothetical protein
MGIPKSFHKLAGYGYYKVIMSNMAVIFNKKETEKLEDGNTAFFLDIMGKDNRKLVREAVEAFEDLHDMVEHIGELFFQGFVFSRKRERVREQKVRHGVKLEDWSDIRKPLIKLAEFAEKTFPKGSNRKRAGEEMKKGIESLNAVFARISKQLHQ